jgi:hypothetical protein
MMELPIVWRVATIYLTWEFQILHETQNEPKMSLHQLSPPKNSISNVVVLKAMAILKFLFNRIVYHPEPPGPVLTLKVLEILFNVIRHDNG